MTNPILSQLSTANPQNELLRKALTIKQSLSGKNPQALYQALLQNNPAFAQFVQRNQGKPVQQLAQEYGVDYNTLTSLLR